jgi:hypothetical protein
VIRARRSLEIWDFSEALQFGIVNFSSKIATSDTSKKVEKTVASCSSLPKQAEQPAAKGGEIH